MVNFVAVIEHRAPDSPLQKFIPPRHHLAGTSPGRDFLALPVPSWAHRVRNGRDLFILRHFIETERNKAGMKLQLGAAPTAAGRGRYPVLFISAASDRRSARALEKFQSDL
ncbi:hypothetical protein EVAR_18770_1 [Eumeta japonica]|uniref:Uncharacterized protein n=1 Tax=Eumeta variegata TaxID=151549 RepID=A0A4C1UMC0_EUMVA|nr:hypothetical protein EVAR_18770_1 [Eumeta japonica]